MIVGMVKGQIRRLVYRFRNFTRSFLYGAKYAAKRVFVLFGLVVVILWISVLLYASFYHIYVPSASIVRPAYFKFRVCPSGVGMCSFPMANVTLCAENQAEVLGRGQQYNVMLKMSVPDSASNRDVGMFMVISRLYDRYGIIAQESSRAVSLKYQSDLLKTIQTLVLAPLYLTGFAEQTQSLTVELFEEYWDDFYQPAVGVLLEIHSRQLTFYTAQLQFHACYAGMRYYLFYYPLSSACFGILFNCLWVAAAFTLSWYKLGLELLEGPQVKAINGFSSEADDGAGKQIIPCRPSAENRQPQMSEGVRPKGVEKDKEEPEVVPRSFVQPFTMNVARRPTETVGGLPDSGDTKADTGQSTEDCQLRHRVK
ncbi:seipin-like isoform X2 [Littorina saxatilis]|uniref:Seipin n=1 Tax=Littorina saxatilis TaxID=31220 RepID=A0AAN9GDF3_9CAEN